MYKNSLKRTTRQTEYEKEQKVQEPAPCPPSPLVDDINGNGGVSEKQQQPTSSSFLKKNDDARAKEQLKQFLEEWIAHYYNRKRYFSQKIEGLEKEKNGLEKVNEGLSTRIEGCKAQREAEEKSFKARINRQQEEDKQTKTLHREIVLQLEKKKYDLEQKIQKMELEVKELKEKTQLGNKKFIEKTENEKALKQKIQQMELEVKELKGKNQLDKKQSTDKMENFKALLVKSLKDKESAMENQNKVFEEKFNKLKQENEKANNHIAQLEKDNEYLSNRKTVMGNTVKQFFESFSMTCSSQ